MSDTLAAFFCILFALAVVLGGVNWLLSISCHAQANAMGIPSTYGAFQGCIVKYHGELIPIENIGVRVIEKTGRD